jgi:hypothetical protein
VFAGGSRRIALPPSAVHKLSGGDVLRTFLAVALHVRVEFIAANSATLHPLGNGNHHRAWKCGVVSSRGGALEGPMTFSSPNLRQRTVVSSPWPLSRSSSCRGGWDRRKTDPQLLSSCQSKSIGLPKAISVPPPMRSWVAADDEIDAGVFGWFGASPPSKALKFSSFSRCSYLFFSGILR